MSCCAPGTEAALDIEGTSPSAREIGLCARALGDGAYQVELSVPTVHCAACIQTVERRLAGLSGVTAARVNLSTKRVSVRWQGETPPPIAEALADIGYPAHLFDEGAVQRDGTLSSLIVATAVAGFAASNIMLLSVSVWSGADASMRDIFHWISAFIALPALIFSGRVYYRSAWNALRHGRMNMDVPIAIGVTLAYAMSLYETINHGEHAYFDASVTLLFFLLIGRTLDHVMRNRARAAVLGLSRLAPQGAVVLDADGTRSYRPVAEIVPGTRLLVAAGERIAVDSVVVAGTSDLDCSLVSGEGAPQPVGDGNEVRAGTLNLTGPLTLVALRAAGDSFLAEMTRLMEAAEGGRARYRRIAERVSSLYAPVVHLTALATFLGWMAVDGDWRKAMTIAIAVLIITCPCALGLAVPIVQVVAARRLFENGIMVKDGGAMERLDEIDTIVFDKTGTLTLGRPRLINRAAIAPDLLEIAAGLAAGSRHPVSQAIAAASSRTAVLDDVREIPGCGLEGRRDGAVWRLGRAEWALAAGGDSEGTVLALDGRLKARFETEDELRPGAAATAAVLRAAGKALAILSGDSARNCRPVAERIGIGDVRAGLLPAGKVARIGELAGQGRKVLMVGDGLNDAPALAAAHVSMAPATAADIGRNAADFVFLRESLEAVPLAVGVARRAGQLIRQNIALAIVYNLIAVPIAILGYVTPLIAAAAMSGSSLLVIANALRLNTKRAGVRKGTAAASARHAAECPAPMRLT
ncbi:MAG: cation-translocating P-type ATPase [Mesorhizobium sp.]